MVTKKTITGLVVVFFLLSVSAFSFASELDDIRAAIKEKHAKWIAAETTVSGLP